MSSRALRRAQREREQKRLAQQQNQEDADSEDEAVVDLKPAKPSMFAMLDTDGDDGEDEEEGVDTVSQPEEPTGPGASSESPLRGTSRTRKRNKRKKKPQDIHGKFDSPVKQDSKFTSQLDEIDLALRSLSTSASLTPAAASTTPVIDADMQRMCQLLAVDTQSLHAANEMRRLFGRVALEEVHGEVEVEQARRHGRHGQRAAAAGGPGRGRGLAAVGLRRNMFVQGKEEWPRAPGGGLSMEIVEKLADGIVEYRFVHNRAYQDVQRQFDFCVASMDPQRMMHLLHNNPYHISTLLQVSEIFKQQRESARAGDLLERALFSFGRAVHSTFPNTVSQGKARLDFRRPENREFWHAAWRYITNLGQRATWRTAYEWAKLLLSFDPEGDPYCVTLILDQFALRARQAQNLLDLMDSCLEPVRLFPPNMYYSQCLAYIQIKDPKRSREALHRSIVDFPWTFNRLFQELGIDTIPPCIWGKKPRSDDEKLHSELYVTRAKDLWNTPEATSLLVEVAFAIQPDQIPEQAQHTGTHVGLNEARHVYLTDNPALIGLLSPNITRSITSSFDPLPPPDSLPSYPRPSDATSTSTSTSGLRGDRPSDTRASLTELVHEFRTLHEFFQDIFPWLRVPLSATDSSTTTAITTSVDADVDAAPTPGGVPTDTQLATWAAAAAAPQAELQPSVEEVAERIRSAGVSQDTVFERMERLRTLQTRLTDIESRIAEEERVSGGERDVEGRVAGEEVWRLTDAEMVVGQARVGVREGDWTVVRRVEGGWEEGGAGRREGEENRDGEEEVEGY